MRRPGRRIILGVAVLATVASSLLIQLLDCFAPRVPVAAVVSALLLVGGAHLRGPADAATDDLPATGDALLAPSSSSTPPS